MLKAILVALDGSEHAGRAMNLATELASACTAKLLLLHVWQRGPVPAALRHMAAVEHIGEPETVEVQAAMADIPLSRAPVADMPGGSGENGRIKEALGENILRVAESAARDRGVDNTESTLIEGDPVAEILGCAKRGEVDLIVMGSRGLGELKGLLIGSVSHKVIQLADCPVLTVK